MNTRILIILAGLIFICAECRSAEPIRVGLLLSLSGSDGVLGEEAAQGIRIAHSLRPTVLSRPVEIVVADTKSDRAEAACTMFRLVERDAVCAVIGDVSSKCTLSASAHAQRRRIPLVSLCGRSSSSDYQYSFTSWQGLSSYEQGNTAARVCRRALGASTVVVVLDHSDEYSISLIRQFRKAFVKLGGRVLRQVGLRPNQYDMKERLELINHLNPEALFLALSGPQSALFCRQAGSIGVETAILAGERACSREFIEIGGEFVEGVHLIGPSIRKIAGKPVDYSVVESRRTIFPIETKGSCSGLREDLGFWGSSGAAAYHRLLDAINQSRSTDGLAVQIAIAASNRLPASAGQKQGSRVHELRHRFMLVNVHGAAFRHVPADFSLSGTRTTRAVGSPQWSSPAMQQSPPQQQ